MAKLETWWVSESRINKSHNSHKTLNPIIFIILVYCREIISAWSAHKPLIDESNSKKLPSFTCNPSHPIARSWLNKTRLAIYGLEIIISVYTIDVKSHIIHPLRITWRYHRLDDVCSIQAVEAVCANNSRLHLAYLMKNQCVASKWKEDNEVKHDGGDDDSIIVKWLLISYEMKFAVCYNSPNIKKDIAASTIPCRMMTVQNMKMNPRRLLFCPFIGVKSGNHP